MPNSRAKEKKLISAWVSEETKAEYELLKTKYAKLDFEDHTAFLEYVIRSKVNETKPDGAKVPEGPYVLKSTLQPSKKKGGK